MSSDFAWSLSSAGLDYFRSFRRFPRLDSTNSWLLRESRDVEESALPYLVTADVQTAGRGRGGRSWYADEGSLAVSWLDSLTRLEIAAAQLPPLALAVGLSVAEGIEAFLPGVDARVKWPNDVYIGGAKVAGVLIESVPASTTRFVVGIGVNVATELGDISAAMQQPATSLRSMARGELDRVVLLREIVQRYQTNLEFFRQDFQDLVRRLRERCLLTGHELSLRQAGRLITGSCLGIADCGGLTIQSEGQLQVVHSGEAVRRRD